MQIDELGRKALNVLYGGGVPPIPEGFRAVDVGYAEPGQWILSVDGRACRAPEMLDRMRIILEPEKPEKVERHGWKVMRLGRPPQAGDELMVPSGEHLSLAGAPKPYTFVVEDSHFGEVKWEAVTVEPITEEVEAPR